MNSTETTLPGDAQRVLEGHLAAVRAALETSGTSPDDVKSICDDLEAQAREMYFARANDKPPRQAMYSVLGELDDPAEFGCAEQGAPPEHVAAEPAPGGAPKLSPFAIASVVVSLLTFLMMLLDVEAGLVISAIAAIPGGALGAFGIRQIQRTPGQYKGLPFAVAGIVAIPLFVANLFWFLLVGDLVRNSHSDGVIRDFAYFALIGIGLWGSWMLYRAALRYARNWLSAAGVSNWKWAHAASDVPRV